MIRAKNISKQFLNHMVFTDLSFSPQPGALTAVIGPSGGGKSTLFRCLSALEVVSSGNIEIDPWRIDLSTDKDSDIATAVRRLVAFVSQQASLWPYRTVFENIAEGPLYV